MQAERITEETLAERKLGLLGELIVFSAKRNRGKAQRRGPGEKWYVLGGYMNKCVVNEGPWYAFGMTYFFDKADAKEAAEIYGERIMALRREEMEALGG